MRDETWRQHAACRGMSPEVFHPSTAIRETTLQIRYDEAKRVCAVCPVVDPCLTEALVWTYKEGIWGSTTPAERAALLNLSGRKDPIS